ncbi:MAG: hypothetical protein ACK4UR_03135 [Caldimicrobium sp.]
MKKFILLLILALLFSCGRKTPPLPIEKSIPKDPDLNIEVTPMGFNLWITLPTETKEGRYLTKIKALIIEKEEIPLEGSRKSKSKRIKLKPKLHTAANLILYTDRALKPNYAYKYKLKIEKDFLVKTPYTEERIVFWTTPPMPPSNFQIIPYSQEEILITWEPPLLNLNGEPLKGEIIYRLEERVRGEKRVKEIKERQILTKVSKEGACFSVQALLKFYDTLIPSPPSEVLCIP